MLEAMGRSRQDLGSSRDWMMNDPDLDILRNLPRFQAFINALH
jgi:hypothetical protein